MKGRLTTVSVRDPRGRFTGVTEHERESDDDGAVLAVVWLFRRCRTWCADVRVRCADSRTRWATQYGYVESYRLGESDGLVNVVRRREEWAQKVPRLADVSETAFEFWVSSYEAGGEPVRGGHRAAPRRTRTAGPATGAGITGPAPAATEKASETKRVRASRDERYRGFVLEIVKLADGELQRSQVADRLLEKVGGGMVHRTALHVVQQLVDDQELELQPADARYPKVWLVRQPDAATERLTD